MDMAADTEHVYEVQAAAVQVYNEEVDDLLHLGHHNGAGQNLYVQNGGSVPGLTWVICRHPEEMLNLFTRARGNVAYSETLMNKSSSRSHSMFHIRLTKHAKAALQAGGPAEAALQEGAAEHRGSR